MRAHRRWAHALLFAVIGHTLVMWQSMHAWSSGDPQPTYMTLLLVSSPNGGALAAPPQQPYAPSARAGDDVAQFEPVRPRLGLWVLEAPLQTAPPPSSDVVARARRRADVTAVGA